MPVAPLTTDILAARDYVLATINAAIHDDFSQDGFAATRDYYTDDTDALRMTVRVYQSLSDIEDRGTDKQEYTVHVVTRGQVSKEDADKIDWLVCLMMAAFNSLETEIVVSPNFWLMSKGFVPNLYSQKELDMGYFYSEFQVVFWKYLERTA